MKRERVLIAEESQLALRLLRSQLLARDFDVRVVNRGQDVLITAADFDPKLILLAMALPDINGVEVCRRLREWTQAPIIMLAASDQGYCEQTVAALDIGADDCIMKPIDISELIARMRAILRRCHELSEPIPPPTRLVFGDFAMDLVSRRVMISDQILHLTPTEYELLRVLATYPDRVLTHREILTRVWGPESAGDTQYLHVFVSQLRRKLEPSRDSSHHIVTEPGVGYQFAATAA